MHARMDLVGTHALKRGAMPETLVVTVRNPDGSLRDLTDHTCIVEGRPSPSYAAAWFQLEVGNGITLGGAAGTISIELPKIGNPERTNPLTGVWDGVLKDADGRPVVSFGGRLEVMGTAIAPQ